MIDLLVRILGSRVFGSFLMFMNFFMAAFYLGSTPREWIGLTNVVLGLYSVYTLTKPIPKLTPEEMLLKRRVELVGMPATRAIYKALDNLDEQERRLMETAK